MPATTQNTFCLSRFRLLRPKVLTVEASELWSGHYGFNAEDNLCIKSHKTGTVLEFKLDRVCREPATEEIGCIRIWVYLPVVADGPISKVMIFND